MAAAPDAAVAGFIPPCLQLPNVGQPSVLAALEPPVAPAPVGGAGVSVGDAAALAHDAPALTRARELLAATPTDYM